MVIDRVEKVFLTGSSLLILLTEAGVHVESTRTSGYFDRTPVVLVYSGNRLSYMIFCSPHTWKVPYHERQYLSGLQIRNFS